VGNIQAKPTNGYRVKVTQRSTVGNTTYLTFFLCLSMLKHSQYSIINVHIQ